jgi:ATP-dependent DNA helicase RecG
MSLAFNDPVTNLKFISQKYAALLAKLNIFTVADLITHFPRYHKDTSAITPIKDIVFAGEYTVQGTLRDFKNTYLRNRMQLQRAVLDDGSATLKVTWFNQSFLANAFKTDKQVILSGKVKMEKSGPVMMSPSYDILKPDQDSIHLGRITPTYALTRGISIKWLRRRVKEALDLLDIQLVSPTDMYYTPRINRALQDIHFPKTQAVLDSSEQRLSAEELTSIMLKVISAKSKQTLTHSPQLAPGSKEVVTKFIEHLDFKLTADQQQVITEIMHDISGLRPMHRLVQGDVGSGKTVVGAAATLALLSSGYQVVWLAPTVVLAEQHYQSLRKLMDRFSVPTYLITGSKHPEIDHSQANLIIGTTAILARQENVIKNLGLVVVDEQHRFGVAQRTALREIFEDKKFKPHLLDMTATPIPRTIALTVFGDIDVSTIKTKPAGRLQIQTRVVPPNRREDSHKWISQQVADGRQVYWVCSLVEESETLEVKSAKQTFEELQTKVFPQHRIGLIHGKLSDKQKLAVMSEFKAGQIDILVSTTVIEVGIDVANATVMVVEDADRLGLAQLHQIRGRVGRSDLQSWCFVYESALISNVGTDRLKFFAAHHDGLEIAQYDLNLRGPGEVYGTRQSGIPDLKIAKMNDLAVITHSREVAQDLFNKGITDLPLF